MGFVVFAPIGEKIVRISQVNQGTTNNQAELSSTLNTLMFNVKNGWKYWVDFVEVKSNSNLAMNLLTRDGPLQTG